MNNGMWPFFDTDDSQIALVMPATVSALLRALRNDGE